MIQKFPDGVDKDPETFNTFDEAYSYYKQLKLSYAFTQGLAWASMKINGLAGFDTPELKEYWELYESGAFEVAHG